MAKSIRAIVDECTRKNRYEPVTPVLAVEFEWPTAPLDSWNQYGHITASVKHKADFDPEKLTQLSDTISHSSRNLLGKLRVRCQFDGPKMIESPGATYGWDIGFKSPHGIIGLSEIKTMRAILSGISKSQETLTDRFGRPESFGQLITRIADILGIESVAFDTSVWHPFDRDKDGSGRFANGERYLFDNPGNAASRIGYILSEYGRKLARSQQPEPATA